MHARQGKLIERLDNEGDKEPSFLSILTRLKAVAV